MHLRVLNFLTLLSLVLCVAVAGLWVHSYVRVLEVRGVSADRTCGVRSDHGCLTVMALAFDLPDGASVPLDMRPVMVRNTDRFAWNFPLSRWWQFFGISYGREPTLGLTRIDVPHWVVTGAFAGPGWVLLRKRVASRRARRLGLCPACGYDLRANVSGVCPECGQVQ